MTSPARLAISRGPGEDVETYLAPTPSSPQRNWVPWREQQSPGHATSWRGAWFILCTGSLLAVFPAQ